MSALLRINLLALPVAEQLDQPEPFQWGDMVRESLFSDGRVGLYDDDALDETDCPRHDVSTGRNHPSVECRCVPSAVVYFGEPWVGPYELTPYEHLELASAEFGRKLRDVPLGPAVYLIQLDPTHAPRRLKVGFSADVRGRVRNYKTGCPDAQVIAASEDLGQFEDQMLSAFTNRYGKGPTSEIFDVGSVDEAVALFNATITFVRGAR